MTDWVISDPHFGHENIIAYCSRPFKDVDEMDETIIYNWNSLVQDEDTVYCLGDWAHGRGSKEKLKLYLPRLKGRIIMIRGSHDHETEGWYRRYGVEKVHSGMCWEYEPMVLLSHAPYPVKAPYINVHGHVHELMTVAAKFNPWVYACVCVEQTDYKPIDLKALIERYRNGQKLVGNV